MLEESSIYVGIVTQRYGRVTSEELRYAEELRLPILVYVAEKPLNDDDVEFDPARIPPLPDEAEIRAFIEEAKREQDEDEENDEENDEDSARDDLVALTPEIEPANPTETVTSTQSNGKRPRWKFWSQN
jgi:hypothetical protein